MEYDIEEMTQAMARKTNSINDNPHDKQFAWERVLTTSTFCLRLGYFETHFMSKPWVSVLGMLLNDDSEEDFPQDVPLLEAALTESRNLTRRPNPVSGAVRKHF